MAVVFGLQPARDSKHLWEGLHVAFCLNILYIPYNMVKSPILRFSILLRAACLSGWSSHHHKYVHQHTLASEPACHLITIIDVYHYRGLLVPLSCNNQQEYVPTVALRQSTDAPLQLISWITWLGHEWIHATVGACRFPRWPEWVCHCFWQWKNSVIGMIKFGCQETEALIKADGMAYYGIEQCIMVLRAATTRLIPV